MSSFFSSPALNSTISQIRSEFSRLFWTIRRPKSTIAEVRTFVDNRPLLALPALYHEESQSYMFTQDIQDLITDGTMTEAQVKLEARREAKFATFVEQQPYLEHYLPTIVNIVEAINVTKLKGFDMPSIHGLNADIESYLMEYASMLENSYENMLDSEPDYNDMLNELSTRTWAWQSGFSTAAAVNNGLSKEQTDTINLLYTTLKDPDVPLEVIKFLLNPTFGNSGTTTIGTTATPLFVSILPSGFAKQFAKQYLHDWNQRTAVSTDDPTLAEDPVQNKFEKEYLHALKQDDHARFVNDKLRRKANEANEGNAFGFSFSAAPSGTATANKKPSQDRKSVV